MQNPEEIFTKKGVILYQSNKGGAASWYRVLFSDGEWTVAHEDEWLSPKTIVYVKDNINKSRDVMFGKGDTITELEYNEKVDEYKEYKSALEFAKNVLAISEEPLKLTGEEETPKRRVSLINALAILSVFHNRPSEAFQMIEYEDGSGYKVNYALDGEKLFKDLSKMNLG